MNLAFLIMFGAGVGCFALFVLEHTQGRISRCSTWSEMTVDQWIMCIGSLLAPIGFFGILFTRI
jgi:hypothetical protein